MTLVKHIILACIQMMVWNVRILKAVAFDQSWKCGNFKYEGGSDTGNYVAATLDSLGRQMRQNSFGNSTKGDEREKIYGFSRCRRDLSRDECSLCFTEAQTRLLRECPERKSAQIYLAGCSIFYYHQHFNLDRVAERLKLIQKDATPTSPPPCSGKSSHKWIIVAVIVLLIIIVVVIFALRKRLSRIMKMIKEKIKEKGSAVQTAETQEPTKLERVINELGASSSLITCFDYELLKTATRNFHVKNKLGHGGFGTVYKGTFSDGTVMAVKRLDSKKAKQGDTEFLREVKLITSIQHKNLLRLTGCCSHEIERLLVYEYMPTGSLDKYIYGETNEFLSWRTRFGIIVGVARGLQYLHEDSHARIVHRDIKASNILLDNKFQPKIADFGLARFFEDEGMRSTTFAGTLGYTAPEYAIRGELSEKADIYSYGVLVLEIVSCRKNTDLTLPSGMQYLPELAWKLYEEEKILDLVDERMAENGYVKNEVLRAIEVAFRCIQASPQSRPSMSQVVAMFSCQSNMIGTPMKQGGYMKEATRYNELPTWESLSFEITSSVSSEISVPSTSH